MKCFDYLLPVKIIFFTIAMILGSCGLVAQTFKSLGQPSTVGLTEEDIDSLTAYTGSLRDDFNSSNVNAYYGEVFHPLTSTFSGVSESIDYYKSQAQAGSEFYLLFVFNPFDSKITVEFMMPDDMQSCISDARRLTTIAEIQAACNDRVSESLFFRIKQGLIMTKKKLMQINCFCQEEDEDCFLPDDFASADSRLLSLGFRKKEVSIVGNTDNDYAGDGVVDFLQKEIQIDGHNFNIPEEIIGAKLSFDPDLNGYVGIYNLEHFVDFENLITEYQNNTYDYIEIWFVLTDAGGQSFLYSRFFIKGATFPPGPPVGGSAAKGGLEVRNGNGSMKDMLQQLGNCAIDVAVKSIRDFYSYDKKDDLGENFGNIAQSEPAWQGVSSLLPWMSSNDNNRFNPVMGDEDSLMNISIKLLIADALNEVTTGAAVDNFFTNTRNTPIVYNTFCIPKSLIEQYGYHKQFIGLDGKIYNLGANSRPHKFTDEGYLFSFVKDGKYYFSFHSTVDYSNVGFASLADLNTNYANYYQVKFKNEPNADISNPVKFIKTSSSTFDVIVNGSIEHSLAGDLECFMIQHTGKPGNNIVILDRAEFNLYNLIQELNNFVSDCPNDQELVLRHLASNIAVISDANMSEITTSQKVVLIKAFICAGNFHDGLLSACSKILATAQTNEQLELVHLFDENNYQRLKKVVDEYDQYFEGPSYGVFSYFVSVLTQLVQTRFDDLNIPVQSADVVQFNRIDGVSFVKVPLGFKNIFYLGMNPNEQYQMPAPLNHFIRFGSTIMPVINDNGKMTLKSEYILDYELTGREVTSNEIEIDELVAPFEPVKFQFVENYHNLNFSKFTSYTMPAFYVLWADRALRKEEFKQNAREFWNWLQIVLAILSGGSEPVVVQTFSRLAGATSVIDLFVQSEIQSLDPIAYDANKHYFESWDKFYTATQIADAGVGLINLGSKFVKFDDLVTASGSTSSNSVRFADEVFKDAAKISFYSKLKGLDNLTDWLISYKANPGYANLVARLDEIDETLLSFLNDDLPAAGLKLFFEGNPNGVKAWKKISDGGIPDFINQPGYMNTLEKVAKYQDEAAAGSSGTVKYYRVQTQHPDSKILTVESNGNLTFNKPDVNLNLSTTNRAHADYYAAEKIAQGNTVEIIEFEVPKSFDIQMKEAAVPQYKSTQNLLNPNGTAPKIVDPLQPGDPFELPGFWNQLVQQNYISGTAKIVN